LSNERMFVEELLSQVEQTVRNSVTA